MSQHTDFELKQINDLYHVTKESLYNKKNDAHHIKNIDKVVDTMLHSLKHDKRVNSIYGKKNIMIGVLNKMYVQQHNNNTNQEHKKIIKDSDNMINIKLERERLKTIKEKERKSFWCF